MTFLLALGCLRSAWVTSGACVWANANDPKKAEVYKANFAEDHFFLGDVANFIEADLPNSTQLAWASFPCQDLSLAGWQRGLSADRSGAFWPFWKIMRDQFLTGCRPPVMVIENVAGLLYGDSFVGLCESLAALGMQFGALVIDAQYFVPQSRPRVFVVALDSRVDFRRLGLTVQRSEGFSTATYSNLMLKAGAARKQPQSDGSPKVLTCGEYPQIDDEIFEAGWAAIAWCRLYSHPQSKPFGTRYEAHFPVFLLCFGKHCCLDSRQTSTSPALSASGAGRLAGGLSRQHSDVSLSWSECKISLSQAGRAD